MTLLIWYHKRSGTTRRLATFATYAESRATRLAWELEAYAGKDAVAQGIEIVTLEADSLSAMRRTHTKYFAAHERLYGAR